MDYRLGDVVVLRDNGVRWVCIALAPESRMATVARWDLEASKLITREVVPSAPRYVGRELPIVGETDDVAQLASGSPPLAIVGRGDVFDVTWVCGQEPHSLEVPRRGLSVLPKEF